MWIATPSSYRTCTDYSSPVSRRTAKDSGHYHYRRMLSRTRPAPPAGFIELCLPSPVDRPPSGPGWVHEIKLDGFRMMVRRDAAGVRLLTRKGIDWTARYPLIAAAAGTLRARSFLLDGEAACDGNGMPVFDRLRYRRQDGRLFLRPHRDRGHGPAVEPARGAQGRADPAAPQRQPRLAALRPDRLARDVVFRHACKLGFEGIVSKRDFRAAPPLVANDSQVGLPSPFCPPQIACTPCAPCLTH